jgi:hypothetical protein
VTNALKDPKDYLINNYDGHFKKYFDWCLKQEQDLKDSKLPHLDYDEWKRYSEDETLRQRLFKEIEEHNADGKLLVRMGTNTAKTLRKDVDPLHLMFGQDKVLERVYSEMVESVNLPALLKAYLEIIHHNTVDSTFSKSELELDP